MKITPMLRQYFDAKEKHPDCMLLFRMGDFYEMFFDDARHAAETLDIALTSRNRGAPDEIPMAGVPHHSAEGYIRRLVDAGHRVAICEPPEDPAQPKGIVKRDVVRVVTPGVRLEVDPSDAEESHFLAAIAPLGPAQGYAVALCDVSTGEVRVTEVSSLEALSHELQRGSVREVLVPDKLIEPVRASPLFAALHLTPVDSRTYAASHLDRQLRDLLADADHRDQRGSVLSPADVEAYLKTVDELGLRRPKAVRAALVGLLSYITEAQLGVPSHIAPPRAHLPSDHVALDAATEANLEIFAALIGGGRSGSLLSVLDHTVTAAGARLLRSVLAYPLTDRSRIVQRLDAVESLARQETRRAHIREHLRGVADIQRLTSRVVAGRANARELVALAASLSQVPALVAQRDPSWRTSDGAVVLGRVFDQLDPCEDLTTVLLSALVEDPPASTAEGGMIRKGFRDDLDELIALSRSGKDWLLKYEQRQREETGIDSLKLKFNKVFGYYLEVTKANLQRVPEHYIRKQTLVGAERFFTLELKEYEDKILHAEERRRKLEAEIFEELVQEVVRRTGRLRNTALQLAQLDLLAGFAELAVKGNYARPAIDDSLVTRIVDGRHPVVEKTASGERFVPNSVCLDAESEQLLIVTGPNMAGKSTIIRQVALIQLMGQIGCFVPAKEAGLGIVDQIFSRVGASDNLAQGQSTFMVEMTQTAHILRHATRRSLIVLDEIGRGTSTFDGLAIAWAVAEHICDVLGARAMFATHYHELTEIVRTRERARNVSVAVKEWNDEIVFLRRLVEGPANQSYGIQVGRLAGLPPSVVARAKQVLANLESSAYTEGGAPTLSIDPEAPEPDSGQLDLFGAAGMTPAQSRALQALREARPDAMAPIDALNLLYALKRELESG